MDNPRDQDPLMLYPMRHIWVSFDKFYPCNVYGMNVYVWADTGEIGHLQERFSTIDPPADLVATAEDITALASVDQASEVEAGITGSNSLSVPWIMLPAFAALTLGTVIVYLGKKKTLHLSLGLPKPRSFKIGGVLLCLLIASTVLIAASASTVNAFPYNGTATIWGSESSDAWNSEYHLSWRKHPDEVAQQQDTSQDITTLFLDNGYTGGNSQGVQGSTSYKDSIISRIGTDQELHPRVAVVDFDHGNGLAGIPGIPPIEFHFMFEDQRGTMEGPIHHPADPPDNPEYAVFDYEIYPETDLKKHFFVLINTCNSAYIEDTYEGYISSQGMPNGRARGMPYAWSHGTKVLPYGDPTPDPGWMSGDGYAYPDNGQFCYIGFHYGSAALTQDVDGLNGPRPYWWWLEQFFALALTNDWSVKQALDEASQQFYGGNFGQIPLHTKFTAIWPNFYSDTPGSDPEWHNATGDGYMRVYGNSDIKLYQPQLTISARDNYDNPIYPEFKIDGQPVSTGVRVISGTHTFEVGSLLGYTFDHLTFDYGSSSHTVYTQTVDQPIPSDCVVTAYFTYVEPTHQLTMLAINQYNQPGNVPLYIDGKYVGTTGYTYTVTEGDHTIGVASPVYGGGHWSYFVAYYYDGDYDQNNPTTLSVTQSKTVYACYWTY
jgi:hypothetical protein